VKCSGSVSFQTVYMSRQNMDFSNVVVLRCLQMMPKSDIFAVF